jgi:hypothetical protein
MGRIAACACAWIVVSMGCQAVRPPGSMTLYDEPVKMRDEVIHYIPIGTRIEQAKAVMKAHGFHCSEVALSNDVEGQLTFSAAKADPDTKPIDRFSPIGHEIQVTMICREGRVIEVKAYSHPTHS